MNVIKEIEGALERLTISHHNFYPLSPTSGKEVIQKIREVFVKSEAQRRWWESFRQPHFEFKAGQRPFEMITEIIPPHTEKVWFIAENSEAPFYPVYRVCPELIAAVIGECFGFEYYIIEPEYRWLLCETHHNRLLGVGDLLRKHNEDRTVNG